jgi:hypothetical protein
LIGMNDDSLDICGLDVFDALAAAFMRVLRALKARDEILVVNPQDAAELARAEAEVARAQAEMRRAQAEIAELEAEIAELEAAVESPSPPDDLDAGVQHQEMRIAALVAAIRPLAFAFLRDEGEYADPERFMAVLERAEHLMMRLDSQCTAVKAWRAWLAALAARRLHDDQLGVVSPSWSPWTGLAPPAGVPIVQRQ